MVGIRARAGHRGPIRAPAVTVLGLVVGVVVLVWVVIDPTGAAGAVIHVAHQLGVVASSLTHHLTAGGHR
jgi:hypothetical protein